MPYKKTVVRCPSFLDYLTSLNLLGNWWSQGRLCSTERPDPDTLAMLVGGRKVEMEVWA